MTITMKTMLETKMMTTMSMTMATMTKMRMQSKKIRIGVAQDNSVFLPFMRMMHDALLMRWHW